MDLLRFTRRLVWPTASCDWYSI